MKLYGHVSLLLRLLLVGVGGALGLWENLAEARVIILRGNFCQVTNEAQVLPIYWRAEITIDPTQVAPPDNVIVHSGYFNNNTLQNPYDFLGAEYGNARGFWTVTWRTNTTDAYRAAEPATVVFSDSDTILSLDLGPDDCGLYTPPEYCITPRACNDGIYYRSFALFWTDVTEVARQQVTGYIAPGGCHTFAQICTKDKSSVSITSRDLRETDTGFEQQAGPTTAPLLNDPAWSTNGSSGGAAQSTNTFGNPPAPVFNAAASNNQAIVFQGGTNAATDQTSKDGFNALYKATVEGFESTKTVLRSGFDGLGTNIAAGNNINRNGLAGISNQLGGINGTLLGMSNGLRGELNSNNIFATRQNTSNTVELLRSVTNLLARTNGPTQTEQTNAGNAAGEAVRADFQAVITGLPSGAGSLPSDIGNWVVPLGATTIDLNPLQGQWAGIASFTRNLVLWVLTLAYVGFVVTTTLETMRAMAAARQAGAASATPGISSGTALAMAAAITFAIATIPALLMATLNGGLLTLLGVSPFAGATGAIGMGIALANAYLPLDAIFSYAMLAIGYQLTVGMLFWVASTAVRFLVGCIVLWAAIGSADARNVQVQVHNASGARMYFHVYFYTIEQAIEPGEVWIAPMLMDDSIGEFGYAAAAGTVARSYEPLEWYSDPEASGLRFYFGTPGGTMAAIAYKTPYDWAQAGFNFGLVVVSFALVILVYRSIRNQTSEV